MKYLLGIDLGTSSVKAMLLGQDGKILGITQEDYDIDIPSPGYAEQNPETWWSNTCLVIRKLLSHTAVRPEEVKGIGLSGQMHGLVVLDEKGSPLRPCIIWADQRTKPQVDYINRTVGREKLGQLTLNPIATGFFAASLMWIRDNQPYIYNRIHKAILPKDYIRLRLTGEMGTDVTDASSSLLFDTANLRWSKELADLLGLNSEVLPECSLPLETAGYINRAAARETGLREGTPVVFGSGDQPAQALGNGIIQPGTVSVTIGTGGQVFTPVRTPVYDPKLRTHTFCHAVPGTWNCMGATLSAGLSLKWLKNNIVNMNSYEEMSSLAENVPPGSEGVIFLPYLTGERTPHMDPCAAGVFFGLTLNHSRANMIRAVMEGVAFSLRDCLDIFKELGLRPDRVIASGGGAKSKVWKQIMADIFECEVYTSSSIEQASMGAAIMAGLGTGIFSSPGEVCSKIIRLEDEVVKPDSRNTEKYMNSIKIYRELYRQTRQLMN